MGTAYLAYLVPLSYVWDGTALTMANLEASPTGRNLAATGKVRLAIGTTRDVVLIEGSVQTFSRETWRKPRREAVGRAPEQGPVLLLPDHRLNGYEVQEAPLDAVRPYAG